jgi:hypothetical protein
MIVEIVSAVLLTSGSILGCIRIQRYVNDAITLAIRSIPPVPLIDSISPAEAVELRNQVKLINLKIEGQIKTQVEAHHPLRSRGRVLFSLVA